MAGFPQVLEDAIGKTMQQLCDELLHLKQSYFTPKGKDGWSPLKASTIKVKKSRNPSTTYNFNMGTGKLRDSITVFWTRTGSGIKITVQAQDDNALIHYLTKTLGRDFLTIDKKEKTFIIDTFKRLLIKNVTRS